MLAERLLEFPAKFPTLLNFPLIPTILRTSTNDKMPNLHRIPEAITDLETQEVPNIAETTRKYGLVPHTLGNQWKGRTTSIAEAVSETRQALTNAQEKALISIINKLSDRRIPPTSVIIKNLIEEIRGAPVRKNWAA